MTLVGPLFWKELLECSRRFRYFAIRSLVAALVLTTLLSLSQPLSKHQVSQLAAIGRQLLEQWAWIQLWAIVLFVPAITSALIASEKENKTIDALFTTCLTDREILWGKLASRLFATGVIITSSIPVLVLLSFLGGFGPKEVIEYIVLHAATALLCAAVGLYYSVISSKPYVAMVRAYFALLIAWLLTHFLEDAFLPWTGPVFIGGTRLSFDQVLNASMRCVNPFVWLTAPATGGAMPGARWSPPVYVYALCASGMAMYLIRRAHRLLRVAAYWQRVPRIWRWLTQSYRWLVERAGRALERHRTRGFWAKLWDWELKSRLWVSWERRYGLEHNPLYFRRAAANVYDPERYIAGMQTICWIAVLGLIFVGAYGWQELIVEPEHFGIVLAIELPLLALVIVILTSSAIAREADRGSLELLILTRLTPAEVLAGTVWGVFRTAWPILALVALTMLFGAVATLHERALLVWLLTLLPMLATLVAGSLLISVTARRTLLAITAAMAAPIFFVAVPLLMSRRQILNETSTLYFVIMAAIVTLALRHFGRRRSVLLAIVSTIVLPLLCMLIVFQVAGSWEAIETVRWRPTLSQWTHLNYASWMLVPLFESPPYSVYYGLGYVDLEVAAMQFGCAQSVAALWLLYLARTNLNMIFGGAIEREPGRNSIARALRPNLPALAADRPVASVHATRSVESPKVIPLVTDPPLPRAANTDP